MARIWYCRNCGYEVSFRGRCHACGEKLVPSPLPELARGPEEEEVGYRLDDWEDEARGRLIESLIALGVHHRFEEDELVVDAADEARVDDLVAVLGDGLESEATEPEAGPAASPTGSGTSPAEVLSGGGDRTAAAVSLLADAARRLRGDPTDMQADGDVAEASAAVFTVDSFGPLDEEAWAAVGRVTRRLLSVLGAEEALEQEIRTEAGVLAKLLEPVSSPPPAGTGENKEEERTVYELAEWLPEQRASLEVLLDQAGISYVWEGHDLLVPADRETDVEKLFDQVGAGGGEDEGDEERYHAVEELFAACGRLAADPTDEDRASAALGWVRACEGPPLLGMDEVDWFRIMSHARALAGAIERKEISVMGREAEQLQDLLRQVV